ncbi:hypothetical protein KC19_2G049800 [Ceratodon purpureus]|uniref:Uncharacterized protein n=1 Tax=Ceratodon purpureus TaxID=3225 RepID=A0A8T0IRZ3_CERPU|nr:hypothetical protein KC19_2G049800 [Ceratodon purpureus]
MEPWQGGGAPWCIGSVFPAPQVLAGADAGPLGPLLFDGVGLPQRLLSTGSPLPLFESSVPSVSEQKEEFLSFSGDAYVPEDLLEEHLQEDILLRKGLSAYGSQILGNRLQLVECRDGDYALFFPTGSNADRIGGALCSRDTVKKWHVSTNAPSRHSEQPLWNSSISLRQPIFQLSAVRKDPWDPDCGCLVAARSLYKVQFLTANQEGLEVDFTLPMTASFGKYVSHVAWNQHIQGEAAVVLETGEILLFDLQRGWSANSLNAKASYNIPQSLNSTTSFSVSTRRISRPRSKIAMHKKKIKPPPVSNPFEWWQCEYAWHPKTLLVAGSREVSLMDFRVKHGVVADQSGCSSSSTEPLAQNFNASVVARIPGVGRTAGYLNRAGVSDVIQSFARADHDGSYEFCVSTKKNLLLFDTRQPRSPLLQWLHGMEAEPPSLLAMCPIPSPSEESSVTPSCKGKVILAASFHSGNIQAFSYGPHPAPSLPPPNGLMSTLKLSHLDDRIYAWGLPSKVVVPRANPNNWATILDSSMNIFQQENNRPASSRRAWDHLAGLVVLPRDFGKVHRLETEDDLHDRRGFSLMQLTGEGNVLAQHFQAAGRLRSVGSRVSPMKNSNADPTGIKSRSKRCNVTKLACFLNYIRNGSGLPASNDSGPSKNDHEPDDVTMESGLDSEDQHALVPWGLSKGGSLSQLVSKTGNSGLKGDGFLIELHQDSNREKVMALVAEALQQLSVPLSIYEIAHLVLRRYLPADLEKLAAGMPADGQPHYLRKYLSMLLTSHVPEGSLIEYKSQEGSLGSSMEALTVPLPVLLDNFSSEDRNKKSVNQQTDSEMEETHLSVITQSSSSTPLSILQDGCDHVRRALHSLKTELRSRELVPDLSLADSVEAWNDIHTGSGGFDVSHLVQYQTSDRESVLPRIHGKPIRGQPLNMALSMDIDQHNSEPSIFGGNLSEAGGGQTSVLDKQAIGTFFGTYVDGYDSLSTQQVLEDSHLCPIQLPFIASSETCETANSTSLSSLRDQFKQWQHTFVPYRKFCRNNLPSQ